jgi:hypothetical protein
VLRFIENNFGLGLIDQSSLSVAKEGSLDQIAGSLDSLFDTMVRATDAQERTNTEFAKLSAVVSCPRTTRVG